LTPRRTIRTPDDGGQDGEGDEVTTTAGLYVCGAALAQQLSRSLTLEDLAKVFNYLRILNHLAARLPKASTAGYMFCFCFLFIYYF